MGDSRGSEDISIASVAATKLLLMASYFEALAQDATTIEMGEREKRTIALTLPR